MVVQGKGSFKPTQSSKKPATSNAPTQTSANRGGAHTLDALPDNNPRRAASSSSDQGYISNVKAIPQFGGRRSPKGISFREMFFPYSKLFSITTIILIVNLIYFIAILIYAGVASPPVFASTNYTGGPSSAALSSAGAKNAFEIRDGHVWRLFTPIFMHTGFLHIAMNSFFLARYGWLTEARFGSWWYLGIYIYSGILGNCASTFLTPYTISCGASGALFGVLLANLYFAIRYYSKLASAMMEIIFTIIILVINLLIGFAGTGGTDNWAHIFGAIAGLFFAVFALPLSWRDDWPNLTREKRAKIGGAIWCVIFFGLFVGLIWAVKF